MRQETRRALARSAARRTARRRAVMLLVLVPALLACWAGSAAALIVHLGPGRSVSYQPLRRALALPLSSLSASSNLEYHGGPVMSSNTNYAFYWAPSGSPAYPAEYQSGIDQYFEDLAHDSGGLQNVDSVATQYTDSAGEAANYDSHFGGAILDTEPYPANGCKAAPICLTDAQLQAAIKKYVKAHNLPEDLAHEYFMLTPPGVEDCFQSTGSECSAGTSAGAYCAYHGSFAGSEGTIVYANDPYVTGNEGCESGKDPSGKPSEGALQGGLSHEHNESLTDPELNAWYGPEGDEDGDKCRTFSEATEYGTPLGVAPDGAPYNQLVDGHEYLYQQEWSNEGSTCKQRLAASAPVLLKISPKAGPAAGATTVKINGSAFTGATAVHFGATSASSFTVTSSTTIAAVAPPGTSGSVEVTVTTPAGTTAPTSADLYKYKAPTITAVSPSSGGKAGGTPVSISGSGFALGSATSIKFGSRTASSVECVSTSSCTAVAPAYPKAALVEVKVKVGLLASPKDPPADQFTYTE